MPWGARVADRAEEWAGERGLGEEERRARSTRASDEERMQVLRLVAFADSTQDDAPVARGLRLTNFMNRGLSASYWRWTRARLVVEQPLDGRSGRLGGGAALAGGFVEDDGSGGGDVERADAAGHGNAQQMVAGAADQIVQARAFAAEHDDEIAGEVELVVVLAGRVRRGRRSRGCGA